MLIRCRYHPPIGRGVVRFTVVITSALVASFVAYFRGTFIYAFSLGCRNLPPPQLLNQHTTRPISPISSSHLVLKGAIDEDTGEYSDTDGDSSSPYFAKVDNDVKSDDISSKDSPSPFFATMDNEFQLTGEVPFLEAWVGTYELQNDRKKTINSSDSDLASPFFANKEGPIQNPNLNESNQDPKKTVDNDNEFASPFFAKRKDPSAIHKHPSIFKQELPQQQPVDGYESSEGDDEPETQTIIEKTSLVESSSVPVDRIDNPNQSATPSVWLPGPMLQHEKMESFRDLVATSGEALRNETPKMSKTMNTVLEVIKDLPSKVDEVVDNSEQLMDDIHGLTNQMSESIQSTKTVVEKTVEKTQETVKDVQILSNKVKQSLEGPKQIVQEKVQKTQAFSNKVKRSLEDTNSKLKQSLEVTKHTVDENIERAQETIHDVKEFSQQIAESKAASKAKVLFQLEPPSTPTEEALDLAGKATVVAAKLALWTTKNVGSLALKGSQSIYDNTIGPEVEEVWNEQLEDLTNSVEKVTGAWSNQIETINHSVEEATQQMKSTPIRVKSAVTDSLKRATISLKDSVSSSEKRMKPPAFVSRNARKGDCESEASVPETIGKSKSQIPAIISKYPEQWNEEFDETQTLSQEIADALDAAERALSMTSSDKWNEPVIEMETNHPIDSVETKEVPTSSLQEQVQRNMGLSKYLSRFETPYKFLARFETPTFEPTTPAFQTAKTQEDLDIELEKAMSLAKEISQALDSAEKAMNTTSENIKSIEKEIDEWTESSAI